MQRQRLEQSKAAVIHHHHHQSIREARARSPPPPKLLYALPLVIVVAATVLLRSRSAASSPLSIQLQKRAFSVDSHSHASHNATTPITAPSFIPYHDIYVRLHPVLGIIVLLIWLVFLFSFLGIVASDFFCPNLSTLASRLGLPDDVAGATLVGFANGAPDMFSTFAALNAGSASLAIGELIGAASFICSVVAGSMVLVKPFKVGKYNFFRDVGFFTIAVAFSLAILRDGQIHALEAKIMVALYLVYVLLVSVGSLYRRRRRRQKERERLMRDAYRSEDFHSHSQEAGIGIGGTYSDNPNPDVPVLLENGHTLPNSGSRHHTDYRTLPQLVIPPSENQADYFTSGTAPSTAATSPGLSPLATPVSGVSSSGHRRTSSAITQSHTPGGGSTTRRRPGHGHSRSVSHQLIATPHRMLHRSSILGAIEFRDVVNSLQAESTAARNLGAFAPHEGEEDAPVLRNYTHVGRPKSVTGALGAPSARRGKSKKGSGDSHESRRSSRSAGRTEEHEEQPQSRPRAVSSPPDRRAMLSPSGGGGGGPSMDDPWRNASPSAKPDRTPSINVAEVSEAFPDWNSSSSTSMSMNASLDVPGRNSRRQDNESESEQEDANSSDVTARPFPTQRDSQENAAKPATNAMSQFPSKALKVLGFGSNSQNSDNTVPPKAQRLLGIQDESPTLSSSSQSTGNYKHSWKYAYAMLCAIIYAIFPTLHNFRKKSILNMITSIITIPAILLLNITLPVVDESDAEEEFLEELEKERLASDAGDHDRDDQDDNEEETEEEEINRYVDAEMDEQDREERENVIKRSILIAQELRSPVATHQQHHGHAHSHHFSSFMAPDPSSDTLAPPTAPYTNYSRPATPDSVVLDSFDVQTGPATTHIPSLPSLEEGQTLKLGNEYIVEAEDLTTCLTAIQCLLAPIFAVLALLGDDLKVWYLPAATGVGLLLSIISVLFFRDHHHITRVLSLCSIGFFIAIVWILSIVNEVVGILQTVGHVFGLSDAILGLTIFAMGNSLGDLVANVTVARMGYPLMALSACFGGPMLNILLGIGLSGTYITARTHQPVQVQMSTTLIVSGISLLAVLVGTLVTVPLNGFIMSRRWALGLISVYVLVMSANVIVEINSEKKA